jgi:hypothetical protein
MSFKKFYYESITLEEGVFDPVFSPKGTRQERFDAQWSRTLGEVTKAHPKVKNQLQEIAKQLTAMSGNTDYQLASAKLIKQAWKLLYRYFSKFGIRKSGDKFSVGSGFWKGPSIYEWQAIKSASNLKGQDATGNPTKHALADYADDVVDAVSEIYEKLTIEDLDNQGNDASKSGIGVMSSEYQDPIARVTDTIRLFDNIGKKLKEASMKVSRLAGVDILAPSLWEKISGAMGKKAKGVGSGVGSAVGGVLSAPGKGLSAAGRGVKNMASGVAQGAERGFSSTADNSTAAAMWNAAKGIGKSFKKKPSYDFKKKPFKKPFNKK